MKYISLGLHCSVSIALQKLNLREYCYPFDWLWCPSKTSYEILDVLFKEGIDKAIEYMTTDYNYYNHTGKNEFVPSSEPTVWYMNKRTGLGITHYEVDDEFKQKLRRRFERLLRDINSDELTFIYADACNPRDNYSLGFEYYGTDATDYLIKIYDLITRKNENIKILYFCWDERKKENNKITYISFPHQDHCLDVVEIIRLFLTSPKKETTESQVEVY